MKNYGLIIPPIETREEGIEHILGGANDLGVDINPSGDWTLYLPEGEPQNVREIETYACTVFNTLNALETLLKFKGYDVNYSDRYLANVAKYKGILDPKSGADPHKIAELIRITAGCLAQNRLPNWTDVNSADEFYAVRHLAELMKEGQKWYDNWEFSHRWLWTDAVKDPAEKRNLISVALKKGTVCVSVYAWVDNGQFYFKPKGATDNHWTQIVNDKYTNADSYPDNEGQPYIKTLDPFYDFSIGKVYYLSDAKPTLSIIQKIINLYRQLITILMDKQDPVIPIDQPPPPPVQPKPLLKWDSPQNCEESVRLMCKEEGFDQKDTDLIVAVIKAESGMKPLAENKNKDGTKDCGICQLNEYWYLTPNKMTCENAKNNPEKSVRIMLKAVKAGRISDWIAYRSGAYRKYL